MGITKPEDWYRYSKRDLAKSKQGKKITDVLSHIEFLKVMPAQLQLVDLV